MTSTKYTKRALGSSLLALFLCVTMLIGSTFAWFSDTAATGISEIQSGTLDVSIKDASNNVVQTLTITDKNGKEPLWEPGVTFALTPVKVVNDGSLALQFNLTITGTAGAVEPAAAVVDLGDVIDVLLIDNFGTILKNYGTLRSVINAGSNFAHGTILPDGATKPADAGEEVTVGETAVWNLALHMQETAGNQYQNMKLTGIEIAVNATQTPFEYDSYENTYDAKAAEAELPNAPAVVPVEDYVYDAVANTVTINTAKGFTKLAEGEEAFGLSAGAADNATIKLGADISLGDTILTQPIACWWGTLDGASYTISNVTVNTNETNAGLFKTGTSENTLNVQNITFDNVKVICQTQDEHNAGVVTGYSANAVLKNITVTNSSVSGAERMGGIVGMYTGDIVGCRVTNTSITGGDKVGGIVGDLVADGKDANVSDCSVDNITLGGSEGKVGSIVGRLRSDERRSGTATLDKTSCTIGTVTGATEAYGVGLHNYQVK